MKLRLLTTGLATIQVFFWILTGIAFFSNTVSVMFYLSPILFFVAFLNLISIYMLKKRELVGRGYSLTVVLLSLVGFLTSGYVISKIFIDN